METILWPFVAHPEDGRSDAYEWNTKVLKTAQSEQRIALRDKPTHKLQHTYHLNPAQVGQARLLAEACYRYDNRLLLPRWTERVFPTTPLIGTVSTIHGDFRFVQFDAPGKAVLWVSANETYVLDVITQLPDRITFTPVTLPDLTTKSVVLLPLLEGRVDGDISIGMSRSFKHKASFTFLPEEPRNRYRYRLNVCLCLDASGSMNDNTRWTTFKSAIMNLLDYLQVLAGSSMVSLGLNVAFCSSSSPRVMSSQNVPSADYIEDVKAFINGIAPTTGQLVFNFQDAANRVVDWYTGTGPSTNIAIIMTDVEDLTPSVQSQCETILANVLNTATNPFSVTAGTSIQLYAVGIDATGTTLGRFSSLSNMGPAIDLRGNDVVTFTRLMEQVVFSKDSPLAEYHSMFDTYNDLTVLSREYLREESASENITRARTSVVSPSGVSWYVDNREINEIDYMLNFEFMSPAERHTFLIWLHGIRGQQKPFWYTPQNRDFIMSADAPNSSSLLVRRAGLDNPNRLMELRLQIESHRGRITYHRVTSAVYDSIDESSWRIGLTPNMPKAYKRREVLGIRTLRKFRFATDLATLDHKNLWQSSVSLAAARVSEPFVPPT